MWKPVENIEGIENGLYEVSDDGRVLSHSRGRTHELKPFNCRKYKNVKLCNGTYEKAISVHRLVARAFIPNPEGKREVNHIDGDPSNNHVDNLEWVTKRENMDHAVANHLIPPGKKLGESHRAIPVAAYDIDGNLVAQFDCIKSASIKSGVGCSKICAVCNGRRTTAGSFQWRRIPEDAGVETKIAPVPKTSYRMGQLERKEFDTYRNALLEDIVHP